MQFEYLGFQISVLTVRTRHGMRFNWSAERDDTCFAGIADTYEEGVNKAKAAVNSTGIQQLNG